MADAEFCEVPRTIQPVRPVTPYACGGRTSE